MHDLILETKSLIKNFGKQPARANSTALSDLASGYFYARRSFARSYCTFGILFTANGERDCPGHLSLYIRYCL
ncbi:hypothetical protein [Clostridium sp. Marseille-P2415]|uniref:hypothetical protein n=1 Tax=Clostridium sp. Marseille-P2415 TaxID=1805471 RepID=UPI00098867AC|nr:hypothetical protein [Clostridium sp. Marseille-P2415]